MAGSRQIPKVLLACFGSYALTELKYARQKWPDPRHRVLPVMIERTAYDQIPNYLKAITVLEPEGNVAAEVAAELEKIRLQQPVDRKGVDTPRKTDGTAGPTASGRLGRQAAAGIAGAFGAVMVFLSIIDAGVAGISEGGLLIGAVALGLAYGVWPRVSRQSI